MGGSVSAGVDNDDLIDNLMEANYIRTKTVERVFRAVDRAFYFLPDFRQNAYRDLAWRHGNLHLSAPCIYSVVFENLNLEPGRSFLNIGSGTGYLSTMAGLVLGPYGVNQGIEIQSDVVDYAYERLEEFKKTSDALDVFEFCEPYFAVGNGFDLSPDRKYDRIYCGAACPQVHHDHIKKYLKINGILIMPCDEDLLKIVRKSETTWEVTSVLTVSFSTMVSPDASSGTISIPEPQPLLLQELCRSKIRCILRDLVEDENPSLKEDPPKRRPIGGRVVNGRIRNRVVINSVRSGDRFDLSNVIFNNYGSVLFRDFMRNLRGAGLNLSDPELTAADGQVVLVDDSESDSDESEPEHDSGLNPDTPRNQNDDEIVTVPFLARDESGVSIIEFTSSEDDDDGGEDDPDSEVDLQKTSTEILCRRRARFRLPTLDGYSSDGADVDTDERQERSSNKTNQNMRRQAEEEEEEDHQPKKLLKREKLDSGISEESDDGKVSTSYESSFSESTFSEPMEVESDDSETNQSRDETEKPPKDQTDETDETDDEEKDDEKNLTRSNKYRLFMEKRIQSLPLPHRIKVYLNHERQFSA